MRNESKMTEGPVLLDRLSVLPYFDIGTAGNLFNNKEYLRIVLSRYSKRGKILRLKKGLYATRDFIDNIQKKGQYTSYLEFIASVIYPNSYLSMEYILQRYNALTETVSNFTLVSRNKTASFTNPLGKFIYHNIKEPLFLGFRLVERDGFNIFEATKAKALFDHIYFRKNSLIDASAIEELRINEDVFDKKDIREFKVYVDLDGSKRMRGVFKTLFK